MSKLSFDATQVAPQTPREILPAGWYTAQIVESELAPTKSGGAKGDTVVKLVFEVVDGPSKGQNFFDRVNNKNSSAQAQEIGQQQLSAICHAVQVLKLTDTAQLHNRPLQVKVVVRETELGKDGVQYDARNEIKGYKASEGGPAATATGAPAFLKKAPPAATPATPPPGKPAAPATPPPKPPPAAPVVAPKADTREFYAKNGDDIAEIKGGDVQAAIDNGADPMVCLFGDDAWKSASEYGFVKTPPAAAGGKELPPWMRKKTA